MNRLNIRANFAANSLHQLRLHHPSPEKVHALKLEINAAVEACMQNRSYDFKNIDKTLNDLKQSRMNEFVGLHMYNLTVEMIGQFMLQLLSGAGIYAGVALASYSIYTDIRYICNSQRSEIESFVDWLKTPLLAASDNPMPQ